MNANVIQDRAAIAHAQNKPFIIEETGMKVPAPPSLTALSGSQKLSVIGNSYICVKLHSPASGQHPVAHVYAHGRAGKMLSASCLLCRGAICPAATLS